MRTVVTLTLCVVAFWLRAAESPSLKLIKIIPLPGVKGRFDHFGIDAKGRRLFVAALGNNTLEVLDIATEKHLRSIAGFHKPTGVLYLVETDQIVVANGDDGTVRVLDGKSYERLKSIGSLGDADNVRIDSKAKQVYVGYAEGALGIIDAATMKLTGNIKLAAHPESFQLEQQGGQIFVNVPGARQVTVIDRGKKSVTATWPMTEFAANFPMALDEASHRLFVGCREPARLVVLDTATGKRVANLALSGDTDDLFYDAGRSRLYVSCGEGFLDVIARLDSDTYRLVGRIATRAGARTSFFSPELDELYLAVPKSGIQPAEIRIFRPRD